MDKAKQQTGTNSHGQNERNMNSITGQSATYHGRGSSRGGSGPPGGGQALNYEANWIRRVPDGVDGHRVVGAQKLDSADLNQPIPGEELAGPAGRRVGKDMLHEDARDPGAAVVGSLALNLRRRGIHWMLD